MTVMRIKMMDIDDDDDNEHNDDKHFTEATPTAFVFGIIIIMSIGCWWGKQYN